MRIIMDIRMYLWLLWVIVGQLGRLVDTVFRGECQSEGYFKPGIYSSRLVNYVISTQDVHSQEDCVSACLSDEKCSSYNFQVSGRPLHKCELCSKSKSTARPGSLVRDDEYLYYEIMDSKETDELCGESVACQNRGGCQENCKTLSFPHMICECTPFFTGKFCQRRKTGNFLLDYNASTINDHTSVSVTGGNFKYIAVYVWVKPRSADGVVFSYATDTNSREVALVFKDRNVVLHLGGQVIPLNISLPENKWSHVCFMFYNKVKLQIYYNGFIHNIVNITTLIYNTASQHQNITELPREITIKMSGTFVPAYDQLSPGVVNQTSGSNLTVTRFYVFDQSWLSASEILRLYNEPYFPIVSRNFRIGWTEFYQPKSKTNTSELVDPSKEPDLANFDLRYPDNPNVAISIPYITPLDSFTLSMWLRVNTSAGKDATIFELNSTNGTILKLQRNGLEETVYFYFKSHNSTLKMSFFNVISDNNWFNLLLRWKKTLRRLYLNKHGTQLGSHSNAKLNITLPETYNATIIIGDGIFIGDITSLNMWSTFHHATFIDCLAMNPGNAAGDLFSWKSLKEDGNWKNFTKISPSTCHKRPDRFDMIFPDAKENNTKYIYMESPIGYNFKPITVAFWIKIPRSVDEFTLISYAVPSQVNEFNVHFATTGIWVYIHGNPRFIPLKRSKLLDKKWHHFLISYTSGSNHLLAYHNGIKITKQVVKTGRSFASKDGVLVVGEQQNHYKDVGISRFPFTGEISQLHLYTRTFNYYTIRAFASRCLHVPGNLYRWIDMPAAVKGEVHLRHKSDCWEAKNGESA